MSQYASDFYVTLNTQQHPTASLRDNLLACIRSMNDADMVGDVLSRDDVISTRSLDFGIEVSERGLLHAHFTWELLHSTADLSIGPRNDPENKGINRRLQEHFAGILNTGAGCYVQAKLLRSRSAAKNYNRKQQQQATGRDERAPGSLLEEQIVIDRRR